MNIEVRSQIEKRRNTGSKLPEQGPEAIGTNATAGCVRLANPDVEELFDLLPIGTKVTIQE